jgi:uncharacterized RDD family membrane protein YckC
MTGEPKPDEMIYGEYAGFVTRLVAFFIDGVIVAVVVIASNAAIALIFTLLKGMHLLPSSELTEMVSSVVAISLGAVLVVAYYVGFWLAAGQTPGKRIMGVRIVRRDGQRVVLGNVVRRFVSYGLSFFLCLGFLWILVDNQRQAWHDSLGGTIVIYSRPTPPELLIPVPDRSPRPKGGAG